MLHVVPFIGGRLNEGVVKGQTWGFIQEPQTRRVSKEGD